VKLLAHRAGLPGKVRSITRSAFFPAYKAGHSADLPVTQMTRTQFQKLFFVTTFALMLVSCATPAPKGPLTTDALMNGVYQSKWALEGKVKLTNGICTESFIPSSSTQIVVKMAEPIAIGDLNGDQVDDAAVILISNPGTTGIYYDLAAVVNVEGIPYNIATEPLGESIRLKSLSMTAGVIKVEMVTHGPRDPLCCPTLPATRSYRLQGNQFVPAN